MLRFQLTTDANIDRSDHVWHRRRRGWWVCVLCGAYDPHPPQFPTPALWMPRMYVALTAAERRLCPMVLHVTP